jgi:flagellar protein FliO/FliZ
MDSLFGEGQVGLKVVLFVIVVLGLLALAFWLVRRLSGGRLGSGATRGRQPRLAVIDQASVDSRRRLVLIRRDNVEHLLIIGGPSDVVVEQNIVRAATTAVPARPPAADTPRAIPLGEEGMWPLQPEPQPKLEPQPRVEPPLRPEARPRPPMATEEPMFWPGEERPAEPQAPAAAPEPAAAARERKPRAGDPLAELAEELSRVPPAPESTEQRRMPRLQPPPPPASTADVKPSADPNLSEMAQRLEAALRRPSKSDEARSPAGAKIAGEPQGGTFTPKFPPFPRPSPTQLRPFKTEEPRTAAAPKPSSEPATPVTDEGAAPAESTQGARGPRDDAKPAPQKSFYDSLEQEMASLLNRPPPKP